MNISENTNLNNNYSNTKIIITLVFQIIFIIGVLAIFYFMCFTKQFNGMNGLILVLPFFISEVILIFFGIYGANFLNKNINYLTPKLFKVLKITSIISIITFILTVLFTFMLNN